MRQERIQRCRVYTVYEIRKEALAGVGAIAVCKFNIL